LAGRYGHHSHALCDAHHIPQVVFVAASLAIAVRVVRQCLSAVCAGSPSVRDSRDWRMTRLSLIMAVARFTTLLGVGPGISPSAAQEAAMSDIGYIEAVSGRVVALARGNPVLVDALDAISDRTRFDLLADSELRLCHYRIGRFVTMRGPARVTISADSVTVSAGKPVEVSQDTCAMVPASKFQGGLLTRGSVTKD
jgi:hypothetical protein